MSDRTHFYGDGCTPPHRLSWQAPCCERCWITDVGARPGGEIEVPVRLTEPDIETCAFCGNLTIFGVYVRRDPTTLPYPGIKDPADD